MTPFFSGPFAPADVERMLALVEERIALRPAAGPEPVELAEAGELAPTAPANPASEALRADSVALFDVRRGGALARAAKTLANLPLRLFGGPQRDFDRAVLHDIESTGALVRILQHDGARMSDRVARVAEQLEALERKVVHGERDLVTPRDGNRVRGGRLFQIMEYLIPGDGVSNVARDLAPVVAALGGEPRIVTLYADEAVRKETIPFDSIAFRPDDTAIVHVWGPTQLET